MRVPVNPAPTPWWVTLILLVTLGIGVFCFAPIFILCTKDLVLSLLDAWREVLS